jgi:hypothetical protein
MDSRAGTAFGAKGIGTPILGVRESGPTDLSGGTDGSCAPLGVNPQGELRVANNSPASDPNLAPLLQEMLFELKQMRLLMCQAYSLAYVEPMNPN